VNQRQEEAAPARPMPDPSAGHLDARRNGPIVVLYYADRAPLRTAIEDHLYALTRYAGRPVVNINLAVRSVPPWIDRLGVSLVVFHTIFLAQRWQPAVFRRAVARMGVVRRLRCPKVALPQDEFIQTDLLVSFLRDHSVDHVFSVAPQSEWRTIYGDLVDGPTTFSRVLTGYLEPRTLARIAELAQSSGPRTVDIGYRAWQPEYWLGRHGLLKGRIADRCAELAPIHGLTTDVSLREEDTLLGDDWYRFLLRARWTIGVEGGASLIDRDGSIRSRTLGYQEAHPTAPFEEVEAACFPDRDGSLRLVAVSPRHLEACATRTAQVLVEGTYNGILEPDRHYLPLRRDLSNLDRVLSQLAREELRTQLAEQAWQDVVGSRRFEYEAFARELTARASGGPHLGFVSRSLLAWERWLDGPSWVLVRAWQRLKPMLRATLRRIGLLQPLLRLRTQARRRVEG
jgi:hypothetical protein